MDIKIASVQIKCKKENVFIPFSNKISFIYGNTGVGKTTLLNLINYALGNNLIKTRAVEQEVIAVIINIIIDGQLAVLERKINSNLIVLKRNNEQVNLVSKNEKNSRWQTISDYFYKLSGVAPITMLSKNSPQEIRVNFSNFMWFSYLRQEELDNTLFYLGEKNRNFKELASIYVMKVLLGEIEISNIGINKEINKLRENEESLKLRVNIVQEIVNTTRLSIINISQEIINKQKELIRLKYAVTNLKECLMLTENKEEILQELLDKQRRIGLFEAEQRYLTEFGKINNVKTHYIEKLQQCKNMITMYQNKKKNIDNKVFYSNKGMLEQIFLDCLRGLKFSNIESSDYVKIDDNSFLPSIYTKYGQLKFDYSKLSSGGKKTIFKICYALAIHIYVEKQGINSILPRFIIIDTPMKNISEREDDKLYFNLYKFFLELFSDGGKLEKTQLIIVDKELPSVFKDESIMSKHFTNKKPLIPYLEE